MRLRRRFVEQRQQQLTEKKDPDRKTSSRIDTRGRMPGYLEICAFIAICTMIIVMAPGVIVSKKVTTALDWKVSNPEMHAQYQKKLPAFIAENDLSLEELGAILRLLPYAQRCMPDECMDYWHSQGSSDYWMNPMVVKAEKNGVFYRIVVGARQSIKGMKQHTYEPDFSVYTHAQGGSFRVDAKGDIYVFNDYMKNMKWQQEDDYSGKVLREQALQIVLKEHSI